VWWTVLSTDSITAPIQHAPIGAPRGHRALVRVDFGERDLVVVVHEPKLSSRYWHWFTPG